MEINLPRYASLQNIEDFVRGIHFPSEENLALAVPADRFTVHPMVVASIGAAALKTLKKGGKIRPGPIPNTNSTRYLERMGLFELMEIDSGISINRREEAGRFIPLNVIRSGLQLNKFIQDLAPLLHADDHEQARAIQYVMSELARNTIEHAGFAEPAVVAAQLYPSTGTIAIGVADCGYGIQKGLSRSHQTTSDIEAIQLAMRPGVTGTTAKRGGTGDNAGAGLFFCQSIALASQNHMVVYSGNGLYKLLKQKVASLPITTQGEPEPVRTTLRTDMPYWQGTAIGIDINVSSTEKFNEILEAIKSAYNADVQSEKIKKKARFK